MRQNPPESVTISQHQVKMFTRPKQRHILILKSYHFSYEFLVVFESGIKALQMCLKVTIANRLFDFVITSVFIGKITTIVKTILDGFPPNG